MFAKIKQFLFKNKSVRQTVAKNTFWLTFGELVGRILRVGVVIYAARILKADGFGVFSYAMGLAALFTIFSDVGLSGVLIREGAKNPEEREKYFSTSFVLKIILLIISFLIVMLGAPHFTKIPLSTDLLLFVTLLLLFDSLRGFGVSLFRATEKMEIEAISNILTQGIILIAGILILKFSPSPEHLALSYVLGSAAGLLFVLIYLWPFFKKFWRNFDKNLVKPILKTAWPLGIGGLLGAVMVNTDTVLIGWLQKAADVGYYSAAQKPIMLLYILPFSLIAGAFFPVLAKFANKDNERFRNILEKGMTVIFLLSLPMAIGMILISDQAINLLFGSEYFNLPTILALQILSLTLITNAFSIFLVNALFACDRQKELIYYWTIGAVGNAVFDLILIPFWGIAGCALATLITQIISGSVLWYKMKQVNNFHIFPYLKKNILATLIMTIFMVLFRWLHWSIFAIIPSAVIIYLAALFLLKEETLFQIKTLLNEK